MSSENDDHDIRANIQHPLYSYITVSRSLTMFAILEDKNSGEIATYEVPPPELRAGGILIHTLYSVISSGTERASVSVSAKSMFGKALARPDQVRKVLEYARQHGAKAAYDKVRAKLDILKALGYSCSGIVAAVGDGVTEFAPGDLVACCGGGYASHCSMNFIPKNLVVKVPHGVSAEEAAFSAIGAVAVQGMRLGGCVFGETVAVVGAGLLGVLAIQMLRAAGCRVIAIEMDPERAKKAEEFGAHLSLLASDAGASESAIRFSRYGVDAVLITAESKSNAPITLAAQIARDGGRIIVVGNINLDVDRDLLFQKELSVVVSRSYGPGRYDPNYEELGQDYPVGHVRWTEQRNLESFLDLLSNRTLNLKPLLEHRFPPEEGTEAYALLQNSKAYTAVIEYPAPVAAPVQTSATTTTKRVPVNGPLKVGCIGAGNFARSIVFPALKNATDVRLEAVASIGGTAGVSAQRDYGFSRMLTPSDLLSDASVDSAFILTRHDSHAEYVRKAVDHGKAVFVEKPLCISRDELGMLQDVVQRNSNTGQLPFIMVGFNRRFAPGTVKLKELFAKRMEPMALDIRVNAGFVPSDSWVHRDGGRIIGEGCHFVDWARFVTGARIISVQAQFLASGERYHGDVLQALLRFEDGSIATLRYLANGDRSVPKEHYEVYCAGAVAVLDDFRKLTFAQDGNSRSVDCGTGKGHREEIELVVRAMTTGASAPIRWDEIIEVTDATFAIVESSQIGQPVLVGADSISGFRFAPHGE